MRGRNTAARLGVSPDLAESLLRQLIQSSLATQEQARVAAQAHGSGKRALVIGGHGKMGGWFAEFLASQGFRVAIADPKGGLPGFDTVADWQTDPLDFDLIVLATPLSATAELLEVLARRAPRGLIFDLGSLKTPLRAGLDALVKAGCRVTSLHPMFGPDTELLSGRHVIFIDLGDPGALAGGAGIVRADHGGTGGHGSGRTRSLDRLCAGAVARAQYRLLHRARGQRRGGAAAGAGCRAPHSIRNWKWRAASRPKAPTCISRSKV